MVMKKLLVILFCLVEGSFVSLSAQEAAMSAADSVAAVKDSAMQVLQAQFQELQMQNILLQEQVEATGRSARMDSLAKVQRQQRIDSLRKVTTGSPLIIEGDTLLVLYARSGGMLPEARVKEAKEIIEKLGHRLSFKVDTLYVYESELSSDIMAEGEVVLSITDNDALWQGTTRQELAQQYTIVIQDEIRELHDTYGLHQKLLRLLYALVLIVCQILLIKLTNWLFERWRMKLMRRFMDWVKPIRMKDYEFLSTHKLGLGVMFLYKMVRYVFIFFQLSFTLGTLFYIFPETETITYTVLGYIWSPIKNILTSVLGFLPSLLNIIIIIIIFHYLVKALRYFAGEIASSRLKLSGFYPDWAMPTFYILRVLLYALMFVMIWPLLPNSNSAVFQGVSVFMGLIFTFGSSSIIGNVMAGMLMTYMRPFRNGDYIKVGDIVGEVVEKNVLVTRIRTRKNEIVTIQNSNMLSAQTSNYTEAAKIYGIIVHTKVTIGYDVPWQLIKQIMESAALDTNGIKKYPHPFMMVTSLEDFYVEYEINAYTDNSAALPRIYSELHQNLLKRFFEAGVEIMSPHIFARRDGIDTQMPPDFLRQEEAKI